MTNEKISNELMLFSTLLIYPETVDDVADILETEDFEVERYRIGYGYILNHRENGTFTDFTGLAQSMGIEFQEMYDLMNIAPTSATAEIYARAIHDDSKKRKISTLLSDIATTAQVPSAMTSTEMIETLMDTLSAIDRGEKRSKASTLVKMAAEYFEWMKNDVPDTRYDTGYQRLDALVGGMRPGNLIVLAARPSVGKSAFAANLALKLAKDGVKTAFFSCEMSEHEIMSRYMAAELQKPLSEIMNKSMAKNLTDVDRVVESMRSMSNVPLLVYDWAGLKVANIRRELQRHRDIQFVVVDYLQLMTSGGKAENRNLEIGQMTRELKILAQQFKIPIMVLSQLNRTKDELTEPGLTELRDSGSIEQDANMVIMLWRLEAPREGEQARIGIKVAKNRNGGTGVVVMYFDGSVMSYRETYETYVPRPRTRGRQFVADPDFPDW